MQMVPQVKMQRLLPWWSQPQEAHFATSCPSSGRRLLLQNPQGWTNLSVDEEAPVSFPTSGLGKCFSHFVQKKNWVLLIIHVIPQSLHVTSGEFLILGTRGTGRSFSHVVQ